MASLVFAVDPILAGAGQIAAFLLCLVIFVFVLIALVFNLVMAFGLAWLREKINFIKMLRPYVESINKEVSTAKATGQVPVDSNSPVARAAATVPVKLDAVEKKIEQTSDRVANASIEFRARTMQVKAVAQALLRPRSAAQRAEAGAVNTEGLEFQSPGYRSSMEERSNVMPGQTSTPEIPQQQVARTRR
jgi:hypothetical protein